tara:strand:+ start:1132 stop:3285 length:2154 start_codon:yes stop_codon:yes gene_type:complete
MSAYFAEKKKRNDERRRYFSNVDDLDRTEKEEEEEEEETEIETDWSRRGDEKIQHDDSTRVGRRRREEQSSRASFSSSSSSCSSSFPRVKEILWDASSYEYSPRGEEKTTKETTVVWSSDVGPPAIFQFRDDAGNTNKTLANSIVEKSKSKSPAFLYARYESDENNRGGNNNNDSFGIVTISSTSSRINNERRVPMDISFRRRGSHGTSLVAPKERRRRYEKIATLLAWGESLTSVKELFYAKCDAMPLTINNTGSGEEEEDKDEPLTPLDMWPMRIGAVIEECDGVKSKKISQLWKVHLTIALEMPSCAFRFAPIRPLRVSREFSTSARVISSLFDDEHLNVQRKSATKNSSSLPSTMTKTTTGFLTLDRARRLCFLKTNSSKVYNSETPLVGLWVHRSDDTHRSSNVLQSSEVWAACLRYASNSVLRKVSQNGSFLVCIVNGKRIDDDKDYDTRNTLAPRLECYDCVATQGKEAFVPHQINVTLRTNTDDATSADAFVLGSVKEIDRTSIAFESDRNNNSVGKDGGEKKNVEDDDDYDDDDYEGEGDENDEIIGHSGRNFQHLSESTQHRQLEMMTKNMSEAEKEVAALENMLQKRHRRGGLNSPLVRDTSVSTGNFSPRSLAADLVKRAERSFANNRRGIKTTTREDTNNGCNSSNTAADKVLRERLRLVRFVVEDQLESVGGEFGGGGGKDDDDDDDADAHILRKYTSSVSGF